uniref:Uncharacterized protein n=1 Tax=Magallana gigas TaxID=29159 RepID=K1R7Y3_MAGGI
MVCKFEATSPANCQAEDQNDQSNFTYGNQYNQNPIGNQYPSPGCAQYPGNQYTNQSQYNVPGQIIQPGAIVYNRAPVTQDWIVPAVLSCLFCCWPLGLMAILAASKPKPLLALRASTGGLRLASLFMKATISCYDQPQEPRLAKAVAHERSTQVPLKGYDDKRQMMALLEIVRDGYILPPQLLYQGKTDEPSQI